MVLQPIPHCWTQGYGLGSCGGAPLGRRGRRRLVGLGGHAAVQLLHLARVQAGQELGQRQRLPRVQVRRAEHGLQLRACKGSGILGSGDSVSVFPAFRSAVLNTVPSCVHARWCGVRE